MATDTYDYTTDKEFLAAPPEQQHSYLLANDPDYAKAHPDQQKAYLGHVNGGEFTGKGALAGQYSSPSAAVPVQHVKYNMAGEEITPEMENLSGEAKNNMITPVTNAASVIMPTAGAAEMGAGRAARVVGGGVVGGAVGAPVGSAGARRLVGAFGASPETQEKAGVVGSVAGSLLGAGLGGYEGYKGLPEETTIAGTKFKTPGWLRKSPFEPSEGYSNPLGPDKGEFEAQNEAQLTKEGKLAKVPVRMPKTKAPDEFPAPPVPVKAHAEMENEFASRAAKTPEAVAKRGLAVGEAKSNLVHGRPFEQLNEEEQAQALQRRGREQGRIDEGTTPEGGSNQRVTKVPEPNPVPPGENPNNQQSVPRRTTLVQNAKRGKEGAGTQLNQIHGPVLYEPKGAGYSGVREQVPLGGEPPMAGGAEGTVGKGPVGKTRSFEPIQSHIQPQFAGASDLPGYDKYVDALIAKGVDRNSAYQMADEDMTLANKPDYFNTIEREASLARIKRILGPEQRGPVRLGPEGRGIK